VLPSIREELEHRGFSGFVPFRELPSSNVPPDPGVYVVVRSKASTPKFLAASRGRHFKGRDPSVSAEELSAAWVAGAQILYVGKAGAGRDGRRGLRKRLDEYRRTVRGGRLGIRAAATSGSWRTRPSYSWHGSPRPAKIQAMSKRA
jgi:hypothetical protein